VKLRRRTVDGRRPESGRRLELLVSRIAGRKMGRLVVGLRMEWFLLDLVLETWREERWWWTNEGGLGWSLSSRRELSGTRRSTTERESGR